MEYPWQYDETVQVGTDYRDDSEVRSYDQRMQRFRDVEREVDEIREALLPSPESAVWEFGTEFSTLDWILEGMMERSGLRVIRKDSPSFLRAFVCEK